jgi:hypothetical protein
MLASQGLYLDLSARCMELLSTKLLLEAQVSHQVSHSVAGRHAYVIVDKLSGQEPNGDLATL